jgi:hypothetical protein
MLDLSNSGFGSAAVEAEARLVIEELRKRHESQASSASTLGLVVNGLVITGSSDSNCELNDRCASDSERVCWCKNWNI